MTFANGYLRGQDPERKPASSKIVPTGLAGRGGSARSEEHTSELQSHSDLVCRLLLEKKKDRNEKRNPTTTSHTGDWRKHNRHHNEYQAYNPPGQMAHTEQEASSTSACTRQPNNECS